MVLLPASVPAPSVNDRRWPRNPIDHFVLARLESEGLQSDARGRSRHDHPPRQPRPDRPAPDARRGKCVRGRYRPRRLRAAGGSAARLAALRRTQARPGSTGAPPTPTATRRTAADRLALPRLGIGAFNATCLLIGSRSSRLPATCCRRRRSTSSVATGFHRKHGQQKGASTSRNSGSRRSSIGSTPRRGASGSGPRLRPVPRPQIRPDRLICVYFQLFAFFNNTADRGGSTEPKLALGAGRGPAKKPASQQATTMVMQELPQPREHARPDPRQPQRQGRACHARSAQGAASAPDGPAGQSAGPVHCLSIPATRWSARVIMNRIWAQDFGRGVAET